MATELSSGAITNILEAVPGIATVLRSPVADAIINLSKAAAGIIPFEKKDSHELIKYAVRRGLIRSDEGDRVTAEIDHAPKGGAFAAGARAEKAKAKEKAAHPKPAAHANAHPPAHAVHPKPAAKKAAAKPAAKKKTSR